MKKAFKISLHVLALGLLVLVSQIQAATVEVNMTSGLRFDPSAVTINAGDTVRWTNTGGTHTTTSGTSCTADGLWDSPVLFSGQTFERTFTTGGTFPYFCDVSNHCQLGMQGTITVNEMTPTPTPTPTPIPTPTPTPTLPPPLAAPVLMVAVDTTGGLETAEIEWSDVENAAGYLLGFAPFPGAEDIHTIDMGLATSTTWTHWAGATAYFLVVFAYDGQGLFGLLSNLEVIFNAEASRLLGE